MDKHRHGKDHDPLPKKSAHMPDSNPDPITGESGAHPVGTGVGAAGAGTVGAVVGGLGGGPIGAVVGAAIGAVAGGLAGKTYAETLDPTVEDEYWRTNYHSRPYAEPSYSYNDYAPAYRTGYENYPTYAQQGMTYEQAEPHLRTHYERRQDRGRLGWEKAKYATQDAWNRVEYGVTGQTDHDTYWRMNYRSRPYVETGYEYDDYAPAYRMGYESYSHYAQQGMTYDQAEPYLKADYERQHGGSRLGWVQAKYAVQDAWNRVAHGDRR